MKKFIVLAMAGAISFGYANSVQAGYNKESTSLSLVASDVVIEYLKDVPKKYVLESTDTPEEAYKKISNALNDVKPGVMYRVPVLLYPEQSWYRLIDLLSEGGYTSIPFCDMDISVKDYQQCLPDKAYILIRK